MKHSQFFRFTWISVVSRRGAFNNGPDPERGSVPGYGRWKGYNTLLQVMTMTTP